MAESISSDEVFNPRLDRLERRLKLLTAGISILFITTLIPLIHFFRGGEDQLRAQQFILVDGKNEERARLGFGISGPELEIRNSAGIRSVSLTGGSSDDRFWDKAGLSIYGAHATMASLTVQESEPELRLHSNEQGSAFQGTLATVTANPKGSQIQLGTVLKPPIRIQTSEGGVARYGLYDAHGHLRFLAGLADDQGACFGFLETNGQPTEQMVCSELKGQD